MRRGLMATGSLKCDECSRVIEHGELYLLDGEEGKERRRCVECCLKTGDAVVLKEKGENYITFFPPDKLDII